jgi:hypothetical protein
MLASLNREEFIALLEKLGQEGDDDVLTAARDLHARITVAGIDWNDLLVPEEDPDAEPEDDDEDDYAEQEDEDDYGEEEDDEDAGDDEEDEDADDEDADDDDAEDDADADADAEEDDDADDDKEAELSAELKKEAADLIAAISGLEVSASTKEDMKEYKQDLADGEFDAMDLKYLRSLRARLGK